ncbi:hypothetical protein [Streptomyces sp. NBC_01276]|uniref:hypothetical protein n=1 Tax=Streptomyces sp. NBC_01276 TaxID=2903808 RepID=UPI00352D69F3
MRVEVRIERLVVQWAGGGEVFAGHGEAFVAALREELAALCAAAGTAGAWMPPGVRSVVVAPAPHGGPCGARDAGRAVARSVHAALAPGSRTGSPTGTESSGTGTTPGAGPATGGAGRGRS